tara:strand:- start:8258 stop:8497 length:240 start_codon:yes stop_codon:yes gene_type:complete
MVTEEQMKERRSKLLEDRERLIQSIQEGSSKLAELQAQLQQFNGAIMAINEFVPPEEGEINAMSSGEAELPIEETTEAV